jgi:transforming growth factor-beta-induced protein
MKNRILNFSMSLCVALLNCSVGCAQKSESQTTSPVVESNSKPKDVVDTAVAADDFKTLATALKAAGLVETLKGKGPFTVFAPTDAAFAKLPKETLADLLKPANKAKLTKILTYHVLPKQEMSTDLAKMKMAVTVEGSNLKLSVKDGKLMVGTAQVGKNDIMCTNGVIHVIDTVLMPE